MVIKVITSCTNEKRVDNGELLTKGDFEAGADHVRRREEELDEVIHKSEKMYTGQQHVRLMRGVQSIRQESRNDLDLWIVSAGYGLIPGAKTIAPYECTFSQMTKTETRRWAGELGIPEDFRRIVGQPFDLGIVLLGNNYLEACDLSEDVELGGPTLFFCSGSAASDIEEIDGAIPVALGNEEAKPGSAG